ncbi:MAG: AbrB/MazE/SpoVT family DNA-binding domain-containing protein [Opitutales bacterium]|nr:AbrB/MazE/SpoVT family DNA-binding domain-containing protein [Opitutales bacterium]
MKTTIDSAGRLVIPKRLRDEHHLRGGVTVEILSDHEGLRLRVPQPTGRLIDKEGVLVQQADNTADLDATAFINQQRVNRSLQELSGAGEKT